VFHDYMEYNLMKSMTIGMALMFIHIFLFSQRL